MEIEQNFIQIGKKTSIRGKAICFSLSILVVLMIFTCIINISSNPDLTKFRNNVIRNSTFTKHIDTKEDIYIGEDLIEDFSKANPGPYEIVIVNKERVNQKMDTLFKANKVSIIADWNNTMTTFDSSGTRYILTEQKYVPEALNKKMGALNNAIGRTQNNSNISVAERFKLCMGFQTKVMQLFVDYGKTLFSLNRCEEAVRDSPMQLRPGGKEFLKYIDQNQDILNYYITSAGNATLSDIAINQWLGFSSAKNKWMNVLGNIMEFNKEGDLIGWKQPLTTVFNKNDLLKNQPDLSKTGIMLGDLTSDAALADALPEEYTVLKIGYFHQNTTPGVSQKGYWDEYKNKFDIVIMGGGNFDPIFDIVKEITSKIRKTQEEATKFVKKMDHEKNYKEEYKYGIAKNN